MKNWIERYLYQIERKLHVKNKKDLLQEIESNIYDELEAKTGTAPTEKDILEFLNENGSPRQVAAAYLGAEESLIGGELFPIYRLVVKIALLAGTLGITIATAVSLGFGNQSPIAALGGLMSGIFQVAVNAVGFVTIIFALIQRFMDPEELKLQDASEKWNPRDLPALPEKKNQLKRSEPIIAIIFLILLIILFNFFPDFIVWGFYSDTESVLVPILNKEVLTQYLPWLNLIWAASLVFQIILLIKNQWTTLLRILRIGLDWTGLAIFLWIVSNPNLFSSQGGLFQWIGVENGAQLDSLFSSMARIGLILLIALIVIETGKHIYKIVQK